MERCCALFVFLSAFRIPETTSIFRGRDVAPQRYPYFATLKLEKSGKVFCGGALISPNYIITTASCIVNGKGKAKPAESIQVFLGESQLNTTEGEAQHVKIESIKTHPKYDAQNFYNDFALLKLADQDAILNKVESICLPKNPTDEFENYYLRIVGSGFLASNKSIPEIVQEGAVIGLSNQKCQSFVNSSEIKLDGSQICSVSRMCLSCHGDAGGPLIQSYFPKDILVGLISSGVDCHNKDPSTNPQIHSRITSAMEWIKENTDYTECTKGKKEKKSFPKGKKSRNKGQSRTEASEPAEEESAQVSLPLQFLGKGYHILTGYPVTSAEVDIGFRPSYILEPKTEKDFRAIDAQSCKHNFKIHKITDTKSHLNSISQSFSVEGGVKEFAFGLSTNFQDIQKKTTLHKATVIRTFSECTLLNAYLQETLQPTDLLIEAVTQLSTNMTYPDKSYDDFLSKFGTHYVTSVTVGSRCVSTSIIDQSDMKTTDIKGGGFKALLEMEDVFKVSTSVQTETAKEKFLSKFLEHKEFSFYGAQLLPQMENGNISEPFDWNEWLNKTKNESAVIGYSVRDIRSLLIQQNFPNFTIEELLSKKNNLKDYLAQLCGAGRDCEILDLSYKPLIIKQTQQVFIGSKTINCMPDLTLLSCGIRKNDKRLAPNGGDFWTYFYPSSNTSCTCNDPYPAICLAKCTNSLKGFELKSNPAVCGEGKFVIGCYSTLISNSSSGPDKKQTYYPERDQKTCTCRGLETTHTEKQCTAVCASDILDYSINSLSSSEIEGFSPMVYSEAKCSTGGTVALGCGVDNEESEGMTNTVEVYISDDITCTCIARHKITCYVICGKFG